MSRESTKASELAIIICARNEAERIEATLSALKLVFTGARIVVADDGSTDGSATIALQQGVDVLHSSTSVGKGSAASAAAAFALDHYSDANYFLLCDADLGGSAEELAPLVSCIETDHSDLVIATFAHSVGGGFGFAVSFARWVTQRLTGLQLRAPISGQRALTRKALEQVTPFSPRFGMEVGMNIAAARGGLRVNELELDLEHRATGRSLEGFIHRGRQLRDIVCVALTTGRRERTPLHGESACRRMA